MKNIKRQIRRAQFSRIRRPMVIKWSQAGAAFIILWYEKH
jgi:hypothetical protein